MKFLIFLVLLVGCGVEEKVDKSKDFADLGEYVTDYLKIAQEINIPIDADRLQSITYADFHIANKDGAILGSCTFGYYSQIEISNIFQNNKTSALRWVMYHELGHCLLNALHDENIDSIMSAHIPVYLAFDRYDDADDSFIDAAVRTYFKTLNKP
jgi:hypothetical protein